MRYFGLTTCKFEPWVTLVDPVFGSSEKLSTPCEGGGASMSTDLELSLYNARSRRHSVALTRIEHFEQFEGSLGGRDLGGGRGCDTHIRDA